MPDIYASILWKLSSSIYITQFLNLVVDGETNTRCSNFFF